jgi:hypothetical protein
MSSNFSFYFTLLILACRFSISFDYILKLIPAENYTKKENDILIPIIFASG